MKTFAIIENLTVIGLFEGAKGSSLIKYYQQQGKTCVQVPDGEQVRVGYSYEDGIFIAPPVILADDYAIRQWRNKASLSRRQFKIGEAVYKVNNTPLMEQIEALLAGLSEPDKTIASISYNESNSFDRLDVFVVQFGEALGMSEGEVDEFFQFCIDEAWK